MILAAVLISASVVTLVLGLTTTAATDRLTTEVAVLRDSLDKMTEIEIRLQNIQRELEEIREARAVIENLFALSTGQGPL